MLAILISKKIEFKTKAIVRNKEEHYMMTQGTIQEHITLVNIYTPKVCAPIYAK